MTLLLPEHYTVPLNQAFVQSPVTAASAPNSVPFCANQQGVRELRSIYAEKDPLYAGYGAAVLNSEQSFEA